MPRSRSLVTAGAGFIGSHLVRSLVDAGHDVSVLVRPETVLDRLTPLLPHIALYRCMFDDAAGMAVCLAEARPDAVFHLAAGDNRAMRADLGDATDSIGDDLGAFLAALRACAAMAMPPRVFVRAGSLAEYGAGPAPFDEAQREAPQTSYGAAMLAGTHYAAMLAPRLPFAITTARLALVYGPGQSGRFLVPSLIRRCLTGLPTLVARPNDRRDLMHVDDAVAGLMLLAARPAAPVINLATGVAPTMAQIVGRVVAETGCDPGLVTFGNGSSGGTPDLRGSPALAARLLGWRAQVPIAEGIARTVTAERAVVGHGALVEAG